MRKATHFIKWRQTRQHILLLPKLQDNTQVNLVNESFRYATVQQKFTTVNCTKTLYKHKTTQNRNPRICNNQSKPTRKNDRKIPKTETGVKQQHRPSSMLNIWGMSNPRDCPDWKFHRRKSPRLSIIIIIKYITLSVI